MENTQSEHTTYTAIPGPAHPAAAILELVMLRKKTAERLAAIDAALAETLGTDLPTVQIDDASA
jgi:hypothetical protein